MFELMRRRLFVKLGTLMLLTVAFGFAASCAVSSNKQRRVLEAEHRRAAGMFAQSLAAGLRTSMLTGDPLKTQELIREAKGDLAAQGLKSVRVFAANGDEVFAPKGPAPDRAALAAPLRTALATRKAQEGPSWLLPVEHEERCAKCHEAGEGLRGVLEIAPSARARGAEVDSEVLTAAMRAGFVQLMTARRSKQLDDYFKDVREKVPAIANVLVYDVFGTLAFGSESVAGCAAPPTPDVVDAIESKIPRVQHKNGFYTRIIPLENQNRCHNCHDAKEPMRGALVVTTRDAAAAMDRTLGQLSDLSVRHIMLSGLGRLTTGFLDEVAATGAVSTLRLYDAEGRLHHDAVTHAKPPAEVGRALAGASPFQGPVGDDLFLFVQPLDNKRECQRCHGAGMSLRGAIEIAIDTREAARTRRELRAQTVAAAALTMFFVALALYLAVRTFVLRPVAGLSEVADRIGHGDLEVTAQVRSNDEMGRLAQRLNEMIAGLKQRLNLSKLVSRSAFEAAASPQTIRRGGQRKHVVVLFSDIRGFTAYSEKRQPEEVVTMLNTYLQAQAEVVTHHGGDIDKFVGDELMALFTGDGAEARAIQAAVGMVDAVRALNARRGLTDGIAIGVGISAGPAIVGAMGAEARMDYTAIGDTVNLGARLCSNATAWQVLVSAPVRDGAGAVAGIAYDALEPLKVKGKEQPVALFAARRGS
jgi:adenylate cyclase